MGKNKKEKRDEFLLLVPKTARRVLDVGCASGALTSKLKSAGKEVVGIECVPECAEAAKKIADRVYLADVESFSMPDSEPAFDAILYADVLEHLRDPLALLRRHKEFLSSGGCVIASIPNVQFYKVVLAALKGQWDYADSGLLDRTHLRFFGRINIQELFEAAGFRILEWRRNIVGSRFLRNLNTITFGLLNDILTYQYYVKAVHINSETEHPRSIREPNKI